MARLFSDLEEIFQRYCKGKHVVDIGGMSTDGAGVFATRLLVKHAASVCCIDAIHNPSLDLSGIEFIQSRLEELDLNKRFDVVFCGEIIEHNANQELFVKSVRRLMEPDGKLIITTPNSTSLSDIWQIIIKRKNPREDILCEKISGVYVSGHVVIHNISTLKQLLDGYGLCVIASYYKAPRGDSLLKNAARSLLLRFRPEFSSQIVVVCEFNAASNHHRVT